MTAPSSVLVCRLSALGDVILTLPVIEALRERFPRANLEFLSREPYGRILAGVTALDGLHLWAGGSAELPAGVVDRVWDAVVDLSASGRSRRLLAGVRGRRRLRVRKQSFRRFAFVRWRAFGASDRRLIPVVERMMQAVAPLGVTTPASPPRLEVPSPPPEGPVLIAPGAGRASKCWPADRFAAVARRLAEEDGRAVRVVGTSDERELVERVAAAAGGKGDSYVGVDPAELPLRVSRCALALTNDSGLLHVAEACGLPVVAIFGPTHPSLGFAPLRADSCVVRTNIECSPCDLHGPRECPRGHHRCLLEVTVEDVLQRVRARLPGRVHS